MNFGTSSKAAGNSESVRGLRESMSREIAALEGVLKGGSRWPAGIGDQLVYLKYHATNCFNAEREMMLACRYPAYDDHKEQHAWIMSELRSLLRDVADEASLASIAERGAIVIEVMKKHVDRYDVKLDQVAEVRRPAPARREEPREYGFCIGFECQPV